MPFAGLSWLLSPSAHFPSLVRRRAAVIVNRVRMLSLVFAVLTPLWYIVDYLIYPSALCLTLAKLRLLASGGFALLAIYARPSNDLGRAYRALCGLFAIPLIFMLFSYETVAAYKVSGISLPIGSGYAFNGVWWWLAVIAVASALAGLGQLDVMIGRGRAGPRDRMG